MSSLPAENFQEVFDIWHPITAKACESCRIYNNTHEDQVECVIADRGTFQCKRCFEQRKKQRCTWSTEMVGKVLENGEKVEHVTKEWVKKLPDALAAAAKKKEDALAAAAKKKEGDREGSEEASEEGSSDEGDSEVDVKEIRLEKRDLEEKVRELHEQISDKREEMVTEAELADSSSRRAARLANKRPVNPAKLGEAYAKAVDHLSSTRLAMVARTLAEVEKEESEDRIEELKKNLKRPSKGKGKGKGPVKRSRTTDETAEAGPSGTRHDSVVEEPAAEEPAAEEPAAEESAPEGAAEDGSPV